MIDNLPESKCEMTGIGFALAGYLTYNIYEPGPFVRLDSLEAIDSNRNVELIDPVEEYSAFLIGTLLSEDAGVLDDDYRYI